LQQLDTAIYPQYAVYINHLKSWNRTFETTSEAASTMLLYTYYLYSKRGLTNFFNRIELNRNDLLEGLRFVNEYVSNKFKKSTITLGELQRFERGSVSFPLGNYPDVLACMFAVPDEKGIFNSIVRGDGFIMFVQFSDKGVEIETSNAYGSSGHADNAHYSDQMKLYLDRGLKKMTLITEDVMKAAVKTYQPGK
jgi:acyl-homoserine lactone acylase PvdQ